MTISILLLSGLTGCGGVPPYVLSNRSSVTPAGPKIADLVSNLKCELYDAANSEEPLVYYYDDPGRVHRPSVQALKAGTDPNMDKWQPFQHFGGAGELGSEQPTDENLRFTLKNIFQEIEYVADIQLSLDVKDSGAFDPTLTINKFYSASKGVFPATGALLTAGGSIGDAGHRNVTIYLSADFMRLVRSPPFDGIDREVDIADDHDPDGPPCRSPARHDSGTDLNGDLGLKETLATALIAQTMNNIALFPPADARANVKNESPVPDDPGSKNGQYTFGVITAQVDFTITENVSGGPIWTLKYAKFPGGGSSSLFNYNRQLVDTATITFVPICIRQKFHTTTPSAPASSTPYLNYFDNEAWKIGATDRMVFGTPSWAHFLPPCHAAQAPEAPLPAHPSARPADASPQAPVRSLHALKLSGAAIARTYNQLRGLSILGLPQ